MQIAFFLIYIALGLFQIYAIADGLAELLSIGEFFSIFLALILTYIPFVGSALGVYGAVYAWGWSWFEAFGLFFGLYIIIVAVLMMFSGLDSIRGKLKKQRI